MHQHSALLNMRMPAWAFGTGQRAALHKTRVVTHRAMTHWSNDMLIKKTSCISGITREMDLPITEIEWGRYIRGALIQVAFPLLTDEQREFILTGITPEEWDEAFPPEPEQEDNT
jgi:hypothetical protein